MGNTLPLATLLGVHAVRLSLRDLLGFFRNVGECPDATKRTPCGISAFTRLSRRLMKANGLRVFQPLQDVGVRAEPHLSTARAVAKPAIIPGGEDGNLGIALVAANVVFSSLLYSFTSHIKL